MRVSLKSVVLTVVFAALYLGAAWIGASQGMVHGVLAAASPAAGLAAAVVFLWGWSMLAGVALGSLVAALAASVSPGVALLVMAAALTQVALATALLRRSGFDPALRRISDVFGYVFYGAVLPSAVSAVIGVTAAFAAGRIGGSPLGAGWDWALVMFARALIVGPLFFVLATRRRSDLFSARTASVILASALVGVASRWLLGSHESLPYPLLLVLFMMAAVYRQPGATLGAAVISGVTVFLTAHGQGPFVADSGPSPLIRGETFVSVGAVAALMVAAAFSERRRTEDAMLSLAESRRALAEAQQVGGIGSFELDLSTSQSVWSEQLYRIIGRAADDQRASWSFWRQRVLPEDRPYVDGTVRLLMETCGSGEFVHRIVRMDGQIRWVATKLRYEADHVGGPAARVRGTCQDVTSLKLAEERLRALFEHAPYPIVVVDERGTVVDANVSAQGLFGLSATDLDGSRIGDLVFEADSSREEAVGPAGAPWFAGAGVDGMHPDTELWGRRSDGDEFPLEVFLTPLPSEEGSLMSIGLRDVTKPREAAEELRFQARHDLLTGLPNRMMFLEHLNMALGRSQRSGRSMALVFADLDDFKAVNDSYGHDVGDVLLKALAPRMNGAVRRGDLVARLAGDEFVVLCEDLEDETAARHVAQRLADGVSEPVMLRGRTHRVSLSAGVVLVVDAGHTSAEDILRDADAAMYSAKNRGKGRVAVFDPSMSARVWRSAAAAS